MTVDLKDNYSLRFLESVLSKYVVCPSTWSFLQVLVFLSLEADVAQVKMVSVDRLALVTVHFGVFRMSAPSSHGHFARCFAPAGVIFPIARIAILEAISLGTHCVTVVAKHGLLV